jgi:hypothetical protein
MDPIHEDLSIGTKIPPVHAFGVDKYFRSVDFSPFLPSALHSELYSITMPPKNSQKKAGEKGKKGSSSLSSPEKVKAAGSLGSVLGGGKSPSQDSGKGQYSTFGKSHLVKIAHHAREIGHLAKIYGWEATASDRQDTTPDGLKGIQSDQGIESDNLHNASSTASHHNQSNFSDPSEIPEVESSRGIYGSGSPYSETQFKKQSSTLNFRNQLLSSSNGNPGFSGWTSMIKLPSFLRREKEPPSALYAPRTGGTGAENENDAGVLRDDASFTSFNIRDDPYCPALHQVPTIPESSIPYEGISSRDYLGLGLEPGRKVEPYLKFANAIQEEGSNQNQPTFVPEHRRVSSDQTIYSSYQIDTSTSNHYGSNETRLSAIPNAVDVSCPIGDADEDDLNGCNFSQSHHVDQLSVPEKHPYISESIPCSSELEGNRSFNQASADEGEEPPNGLPATNHPFWTNPRIFDRSDRLPQGVTADEVNIRKADTNKSNSSSSTGAQSFNSLTPVELIEVLTTTLDYGFLADFFLIYRCFLSPMQLARLLILRFRYAL